MWFRLDGAEVEARPGESILQAADRLGVRIPRLCYLEGQRVDGNCRACVVEIEGERVLAPACARTPRPGMVVHATNERARTSQRLVLELLLSDMPAEPHARDTELDRWARELRLGEPRFEPLPTAVGPTPAPDLSHPAISVRLDACIQCTRCVRACREVQVNDVIGYAGWGAHAKIVFDVDDPMGESTCVTCGQCVEACPTGAILDAGPPSDVPVIRPPARSHEDSVARRDAEAERYGDGTVDASAAVAPLTGREDPDRVDSKKHFGDSAASGEPAKRTNSSPDDSSASSAALRENHPEEADVPDAAAAVTSVPTVCPYCGVGCQVAYHVKGDAIVRATALDGPSNRLRLCVKGRYGYDYPRHPHRLTVPLIRRDDAPKTPDGIVDPANPWDVFREATWEEALDRAAEGLRRVRDTHGPDALAALGTAKGSNEEAYLLQKLVRTAFGTNSVDHCARLCHSSSVAAMLEMLGSGAGSNPVEDVLLADVVLIAGSNPTVNHPVSATFIKNAVEAGARLIVMDPRRPEIARLATLYLQHEPGTDVAMLNAMARTIVEEGLVDETFVAERTEGYDELRRRLVAYAPELVAQVCGIPAATLREAARLYASAGRAMIFWGMGITQHAHGTDNARCLVNLALLTGHIGRRGAGLHPLRGQNNVQGASDMGLLATSFPDYRRVDDPEARARFAALWDRPLSPAPGHTVVEMMDAAREAKVRGMYLMGENPAMSDPDLQRVREALASLEWMVSQEIFLTETAAFADVVLPASAQPEKWGTYTNTDRRVQIGRPVLEPPGRARQDWWILQEIANRLGCGWAYVGPADVFEEIRRAAPSYAGVTRERLEREGAVTTPCLREGDPGTEVLFTERFPTASGRARLATVGLTPPAEPPDEDYPWVLITGRFLEHWNTGAVSRRSEILETLEPVPTVSLHRIELDRLGAREGDPLIIASRRGRVTALARRDDGVPAGVAFLPFAYVEAAANLLTISVLDPSSRIPEFKYCAVRIARGG